MTPRQPQQVDTPAALGDPSTAPTRPAQRAMPEIPVRRTPITNVEIYDLLTTMRSENAREVGDIKREVRDIRDEQRAQREEINELKRTRVARPKLESLSDIEDGEVVSGSVLRQAMRRQTEHTQAATDAQTLKLQAEAKALLWKPVLATVSAIVLGLAAQYFAARGTISSEVKSSTKEAVREEATTVAKEAAEAVKESVQAAPK